MFPYDYVGSPETRRTLISLWQNHIVHLTGVKYTGIKPETMVKHWIRDGLKPATIRKLLSIYKRWYKEVHGDELHLAHLVKKVNRMQIPEEVKAWSKEEARKALDTARHLDNDLYQMMLVALHTGLRKGELFGLKGEDVDFVSGHLNVKRSWDGPTKSGRPRTVPMSEDVEKVLGDLYVVGSDDYLFKWCDPNPRLKQICKHAEVRKITWHGLRHTFATLALEARRSPKEVADILGHASVSTTFNLYWSKTGKDMDLGFLP